jgi:uncharacterized protein RhaS with RHS repeats
MRRSGISTFTYNDDGLMASRVDAAGTTNYTYDSVGRHGFHCPASGRQ